MRSPNEKFGIKNWKMWSPTFSILTVPPLTSLGTSRRSPDPQVGWGGDPLSTPNHALSAFRASILAPLTFASRFAPVVEYKNP